MTGIRVLLIVGRKARSRGGFDEYMRQDVRSERQGHDDSGNRFTGGIGNMREFGKGV